MPGCDSITAAPSARIWRALDSDGREIGETVRGLGTLYTWNVLSPRLGLTARLDADGRTLLRASYGRYHAGRYDRRDQPACTPASRPLSRATSFHRMAGYTRVRSVVDRSNLQLDPQTRPPRTDAYSIGVDRGVGRHAAVAIAYVRKDGADFIGWEDVGGRYLEDTRPLPDGRSVPVLVLAARLARPPFPVDESRGILADVRRPRPSSSTSAGRMAGRRLPPTRCREHMGCSRPVGRQPRARR